MRPEHEEDDVPPADEPGTTYLRESWRVRAVMAVLPVAIMTGLAVAGEGTIRILGLIGVVVLLLDELIRLGRPVAKLTPTMIVVNAMRPQEVAWHRIRGVTTMTRFGSHRIVLEIDNGDTVVLGGPTANFVARGNFDTAMETIKRTWTERRDVTRPAAQQPDAQ